MYGMSKVVSFEPQVNSTMEYFFERLDHLFADKNKVCDFAFWLQAFAFDVIGEITFSKRIGFLEKGKDIQGIMGSIWKYFTAASPVSFHPVADPLIIILFYSCNITCIKFLQRNRDLGSLILIAAAGTHKCEIHMILTKVGLSDAMVGSCMDQESDTTTTA